MEESKEIQEYLESKRIRIGSLSKIEKTVNISFALNNAWLIRDGKIIEGFGFKLNTNSFFNIKKERKFFKEKLDDELWVISNSGLTFNLIFFNYELTLVDLIKN